MDKTRPLKNTKKYIDEFRVFGKTPIRSHQTTYEKNKTPNRIQSSICIVCNRNSRHPWFPWLPNNKIISEKTGTKTD